MQQVIKRRLCLLSEKQRLQHAVQLAALRSLSIPPRGRPSKQAKPRPKTSLPAMLRIVRSPAFQRQLAARSIATFRPLFMAMQTMEPLTSLNNAAAKAGLELEKPLVEMAASHFSESSAFPEFSPSEDTLLSEAVPRIPDKQYIMDAHAMAEEELTAEMQMHFCESSDFPEYTPAEEEAMIHMAM